MTIANNHVLEYFSSNGSVTNPGKYADLYMGIPDDLGAIRKLVYGLMVHYQYVRHENCKPALDRFKEVHIREVEKMLEQILELDNRALSESRIPEKRLLTSCRGYSALLCSILRYKKTPCRTRFGFANFFDSDPNFNFDHVTSEVWNNDTKVWQLVERAVPDERKKNFYHLDFDLENVPREKFTPGNEAWLMCRSGRADPNKFGTGYLNRRSGFWYIRNVMLRDLAALNKREMTSTDGWGIMIKKQSINDVECEHQLPLLDKIAELMMDVDQNLPELQKIYSNNPHIMVRPPIKYFKLMSGVVEDAYISDVSIE